MNSFQKLTVGGLSVLILALASSVPSMACGTENNSTVENPDEVICRTTVRIVHGERVEKTTCKSNMEWKSTESGCKLKRSYLRDYRNDSILKSE